MADLSKTSLTWNGLTIGQNTAYRMLTLEGWEELPASRYDKQVRATAHGSHPTPVYADERIVTVEGYCWDSADRDALLAELRGFVTYDDTPDESTDPLAVTAAGKTLTAGAQLLVATAKLTRGEWGTGRFGWLLQWRCPDPRRYGDPDTLSTPLPSSSGGLTYPLAYPLAYGTAGATGRITLTNPGTAAAPILLKVTGPHDDGFEVSAVETGQRLTYPVAVPAGQAVELDTAAGSVLVEGTASRRGNLSNADWMLVPRRDPKTKADGTLTLQFTSLGGVPSGAALLQATVSETNW